MSERASKLVSAVREGVRIHACYFVQLKLFLASADSNTQNYYHTSDENSPCMYHIKPNGKILLSSFLICLDPLCALQLLAHQVEKIEQGRFAANAAEISDFALLYRSPLLDKTREFLPQNMKR